MTDEPEVPTDFPDSPEPNVFPIDVTYVDSTPRHIEVEARSHHEKNTYVSVYRFRYNDGCARLERIEAPDGTYHVPGNADGRAAVGEAVADLPFVDEVVMLNGWGSD